MKVFLTGASSGIGEALARHYARAGATLGLVARRADRLETLKASLGVPAEAYPCDVRDAPALAAAVRRESASRTSATYVSQPGMPALSDASSSARRATRPRVAPPAA